MWPCIGNLGSSATIISSGFSRRPMNFGGKNYQRATQKNLNNMAIGKVKLNMDKIVKSSWCHVATLPPSMQTLPPPNCQ
jgi:hypothetical protein